MFARDDLTCHSTATSRRGRVAALVLLGTVAVLAGGCKSKPAEPVAPVVAPTGAVPTPAVVAPTSQPGAASTLPPVAAGMKRFELVDFALSGDKTLAIMSLRRGSGPKGSAPADIGLVMVRPAGNAPTSLKDTWTVLEPGRRGVAVGERRYQADGTAKVVSPARGAAAGASLDATYKLDKGLYSGELKTVGAERGVLSASLLVGVRDLATPAKEGAPARRRALFLALPRHECTAAQLAGRWHSVSLGSNPVWGQWLILGDRVSIEIPGVAGAAKTQAAGKLKVEPGCRMQPQFGDAGVGALGGWHAYLDATAGQGIAVQDRDDVSDNSHVWVKIGDIPNTAALAGTWRVSGSRRLRGVDLTISDAGVISGKIESRASATPLDFAGGLRVGAEGELTGWLDLPDVRRTRSKAE